MKTRGIEAITPKPQLSAPGKGHKIYPYLLRNRKVSKVDEVWCTDITYIPMATGHAYLNAIMDWHSRCVELGTEQHCRYSDVHANSGEGTSEWTAT